MQRLAIVLVLPALLAAACSSSDPEPATTVAATTPSTTVPATTAAPDAEDQRAADGFGLADPVEALGIGDEYFPELGNPGYDVEHYTLDLVFDPDQTHLAGVATIEATALEVLPTFNLDFSTLTIDSIAVDGEEARFETVNDDVVILPRSAPAQGETFVIQVEYGGIPGPASSGGVPFGIGWITSGSQNYVVAEPDAAHSWFPSNDHPLDKATFTFRITVPDDVAAAANGTLADQITDLGQTTWVWEMPAPMATYLATVVIGDFEIVEDAAASAAAGIPIRHVLPRGTTVADWPGLERQGEMVAFLEELFGPYPFDNYGIAIVEGFGAALENQTLSLFDSNIAESAFFEDVLIHELAHQWFGNSVSPGQWQDIWLNEGFASYAEWLWIERESGRDTLEQEIALERSQFAGSGLNPPGRPAAFDLFGAAVYRVGAMTLHAFRLTVGDDVFFESLRTYVADFADGAAVTGDFVRVAEAVAGTELEELFDAWLFDRAVPEFPAGT